MIIWFFFYILSVDFFLENVKNSEKKSKLYQLHRNSKPTSKKDKKI